MSSGVSSGTSSVERYSPEYVLKMLKEGNQRFYQGESIHPNTAGSRLELAARESQAHHAYATVFACSDSRVPVELIFDAGVMDIFVIRVAGNVCGIDQCASIEYGLLHVNTPVLVVLGHTQCGAVTAAAHILQGNKLSLEGSIPDLVDKIKPAVEDAARKKPHIKGDEIIPDAIEENVYRSIYDLFVQSPAVRDMVHAETVMIVGAIYDIGSGQVKWLPLEKTKYILTQVTGQPGRGRI